MFYGKTNTIDILFRKFARGHVRIPYGMLVIFTVTTIVISIFSTLKLHTTLKKYKYPLYSLTVFVSEKHQLYKIMTVYSLFFQLTDTPKSVFIYLFIYVNIFCKKIGSIKKNIFILIMNVFVFSFSKFKMIQNTIIQQIRIITLCLKKYPGGFVIN